MKRGIFQKEKKSLKIKPELERYSESLIHHRIGCCHFIAYLLELLKFMSLKYPDIIHKNVEPMKG